MLRVFKLVRVARVVQMIRAWSGLVKTCEARTGDSWVGVGYSSTHGRRALILNMDLPTASGRPTPGDSLGATHYKRDRYVRERERKIVTLERRERPGSAPSLRRGCSRTAPFCLVVVGYQNIPFYVLRYH